MGEEEEIEIDVPTSPDEPILSDDNNEGDHHHHLSISPAELQKKEEELVQLHQQLLLEQHPQHPPHSDDTPLYGDTSHVNNDNNNKNNNKGDNKQNKQTSNEGKGAKKQAKEETKPSPLPPPSPSTSPSPSPSPSPSTSRPPNNNNNNNTTTGKFKVQLKDTLENPVKDPIKEGMKDMGKDKGEEGVKEGGGGGGGVKKRTCPRAGRFGGRAQSLLVDDGWKFSSLLLSSQLTKLPTFEKISLSASFPSFKKKKEKKKSNNNAMLDSDGEGEEEEGEGSDHYIDMPSNIDNPSFTCKLQSDYLSLFYENQRKIIMEFRNAKIKKQFGLESLSAGFVSSVISRERNVFIRSTYKPSKSALFQADLSFLPFSSLTKLNLAYSYVNDQVNLSYYAKKDEGWNVGGMMSAAVPIEDYSSDLLLYAGLSASAYISSYSPSPSPSPSLSPSPSSSDSSSDLPRPPRKSFARSPKKSQSQSHHVINPSTDPLPPFPSSVSISDIKLNLSLLFSSVHSSSSLSLFLDNVTGKRTYGGWIFKELNAKTDIAAKVSKKEKWNYMVGVAYHCDKDTLMKLRVNNSQTFALHWSKKYVKEKFKIQIAVETPFTTFLPCHSPSLSPSSPSSSSNSLLSSPSSSFSSSFLNLPKIGIQFRWG